MGFKRKYISDGVYDVVDTLDPSFAAAEVAWIKQLGGNPIIMKGGDSVIQMVERLRQRASNSPIKLLRFHGHGFPGFQAIASGKIQRPHSMAAISTDHFQSLRNILGRLSGQFAGGAYVYLMGCNVASGDKGKQLLQNLAGLWRVPVTGAVEEQYVCGYSSNASEECKALTMNYEGPTETVYP